MLLVGAVPGIVHSARGQGTNNLAANWVSPLRRHFHGRERHSFAAVMLYVFAVSEIRLACLGLCNAERYRI